MDDIIM